MTLGLSLTIPLSLVGQMILQGRTEGWLHWLGALVVVGSFVFVEREEVKEEAEEVVQGVENPTPATGPGAGLLERSNPVGDPDRDSEEIPS